MSAANVKNVYGTALGVAGVTIAPGVTARIEQWDVHGLAPSVKAWERAGVLEIEVLEDAPALPIPNGLPGLPSVSLPGMPSPEDIEKDRLIAELKALTGEEKTRKTSLESLQKQVEAAQAAKIAGQQ